MTSVDPHASPPLAGEAESVLRGALIGYGWIAQHGHAPFYRDHPGTQLVAVADVCEARRLQAQRDFPDVRTYPDVGSLLHAEAKHLDFVDIATPPCDHAAIAIEALGSGLHVLCEKPLATSSVAAGKMLEAARRNERVLFPCHNYKHAPVIRTVRKLLEEGHIGRVHLVTLDTFRNTHARGVAEWKPDWRREQSISGGGIAMDHGSHTFYLAFDWLGGLPSAVTAKMSARGNFDTEDTFSCSVTLPGGVAVARLTWTAGVRRVHYTIHGDRGAITVNDDEVELAIMGAPREGGNGAATWQVRKEAVPSDWMDASHVTWFTSLFEQFRLAITRGDYVSDEAMQAWSCVRLIETAYASARQGCAELAVLHPTTLQAENNLDGQEDACPTGVIHSFS
jgi:predicted dehydrogenase